ncbi:Major facilitator superfamily domain, general substrate transporter [Metarhizium album ARSEF 1941]|uniref:Major facilitator superfamily domain, general substrate transporter n=1 Tax=Metarhizium album (strain ARSEF 1941) TaxID=1081103 RepID=A0A0B2WUL9_METAS|nr:Major facilitator superfamily domain, general substrate transporter [Metarhizium album ARSEF 1941]KHN96655.1 Major facilitator superfamily domain, general substrate transporter [Metarhizium album ARSEF 1941]
MFTALLGHLHAHEPFEDTPVATGDFDRTPPPSNRPSLSLAGSEGKHSCIADRKATATGSRVSDLAEKSSRSVPSQELFAVHQENRAVREKIAKPVAAKVSQLSPENQSIKVQVKIEHPLQGTRVPFSAKVHWSGEPRPLSSSPFLPTKHQQLNHVLEPASSSMAHPAPSLQAIAAETGVMPSSEIVSHSPREPKLVTRCQGHSCVSKVRPAEEDDPAHEPAALGRSQRLDSEHHPSAVALFGTGKKTAHMVDSLDDKLTSLPPTADSFNVSPDTSPQENSAGNSHATEDIKNEMPRHLDIYGVSRCSSVQGNDLSGQIADKISGQTTPILYNDLSVPVSKVRPFASEPNLDIRTGSYPIFGPKVQTLLDPTPSHICSDVPMSSFSTEPTLDSVVNEISCRGDSFSTIGSHKGHHHPRSPRMMVPMTSGDHSIENCPASYKVSLTADEALNHSVMRSASPNGGGLSRCGTPANTNDTRSGASKLQLSGRNRETSDKEFARKYPLANSQPEEALTRVKKPNSVAGRRTTPESYSRMLHSPVPVSKVRPAFQTESASNLQAHEHSSISKVGHVVDYPGQGSQREESHFMTASDECSQDKGVQAHAASSRGSSSHTQAVGSMFDYKRTTQWLKDVLKHPPTRSPKYTSRPGQNTQQMCNTWPEQKFERSCTAFPNSPERRSLSPENESSRFDRIGFKRAVSDLEKLLNEALAIATQVVDHPTSTGQQAACKQNSPSCQSQCRSIGGGLAKAKVSHVVFATPSVDGSSGDLGPAVSEDEAVQGQAGRLQRAQPRSGLNEFLNTRSSGDGIDQKSTQGLGGRGGLRIPRRKSSIKLRTVATTQLENGAAVGYQAIQNPRASHAKEFAGNLEKPPQESQAGNRTGASGPTYGPLAATDDMLPERDIAGRPLHTDHGISLRRRSHSPLRKRFVAAVACISTGLIGIILGIYSGLVPSIQYYVLDESHVIIHGNTGCFLGLALPTFFLWPLPLLHGRKPYILSSLVLAMPLLFPQALSVNSQRLRSAVLWRCTLLTSRTLMGVSLGFASMNFHSILTDLFGASLMSCNPHQEVVDDFDARRHGGGMGVWLGIWTWSWVGSLGVGFLVGAGIIDSHPPAWGFYVSIITIAVVLILNVVCPEVRRSAYRRSVAEVRTGEDISRRVARGEIMMHRVKTGPKWWGQEVYHGIALSCEMLRQPGFAVLTVYSAWIYAQVVLIIILLGSLVSRYYYRRSTEVGLFVGCMALGALLATPFQKANLFSRSRQAQLNSNLATLDRKVAWSSHLVRRTIFTLLLPLAGIGYAAVSSGPPIHVSVPTLFSGLVGFFSSLAISECNGLVMEAFDCSDLSPVMTGRQRGGSGKNQKKTNYSSFPRVTAGFASIHALAFFLAAGSTALGGYVTRTLGQQVSTGVVAGILLILTLLLLFVLLRFTEVQIVPKSKSQEMDRLVEARRRSTIRRVSMPSNSQAIIDEERAWRPAMIGNPTSKKRRMNIFELGGMTRWQEIRKKNQLIDAGAHLNREAWDQGMDALDDQLGDFRRDAHDLWHGKKWSARRLRRTDESSDAGHQIEMRNLEEHGKRGRRECALSRTSDEGGEVERRRRGKR